MKYTQMSNEDLINEFAYELEGDFEHKDLDRIKLLRDEILNRMSSGKPAEFK